MTGPVTGSALDITIAGVDEANAALKAPNEPFHACVSMVDVAATWRPRGLIRVPHVLEMEFNDDYAHEAAPMSPAQASEIVDFLRMQLDMWSQRWLIHCHAGISRSTAVALVLLYIERTAPRAVRGRVGDPLPWSADVLARELVRLRPRALPNLHMVRLLENELGLDGERADRVLTDAALMTMSLAALAIT